jgi:SnoaL-like polyketide cyclase
MIRDGLVMQSIALEISQSAVPGWRLLPRCVRWHVGAFPGVSASAQAYYTSRFAQSLIQPGTTGPRNAVAETAARLSTAFPQLVRRVVAVAMGGPITVRLECEGRHDGMWGAIIQPTRRRVSFEEQHEIVALDGRMVSDRITLDVEHILNQLSGSGRIDPDETAPEGLPRRHAH